MGRYTLQELAALRNERKVARELELMEARKREQRSEEMSELQFFKRFEHREHTGCLEEIGTEGRLRFDLYRQCEANSAIREQLLRTRRACSEEEAATRSIRLACAREKAGCDAVLQHTHAELVAMQERLFNEQRGILAAESRNNAIRCDIAAERWSKEEEVQRAMRYATCLRKEEDSAYQIHSESASYALATQRALREIQDGLEASERQASHQRLLMEAACVRQDIRVHAFKSRSMALRYSETSAARQAATSMDVSTEAFSSEP
eukprot:TRINITY_DN57040_c0_g1_i1.p1 TRINITY_DN57040_c0_g1~~TRINITY_DN57040_c0_g1_i1.p1  ORF type:complete len:264 (+),score=47.43 TRINITY_DN57040_c0_g1_i1:252-1043(+)